MMPRPKLETKLSKSVAPKVIDAMTATTGNIVKNVREAKQRIVAGAKDIRRAYEGNKQANGGKFVPFSLAGTYTPRKVVDNK